MDLTTTPVPSKPVIFFIFGATGDLTSRKLIPALYNLFLEKWMLVNFAIIGVGRTAHREENFRPLMSNNSRVILEAMVDGITTFLLLQDILRPNPRIKSVNVRAL